MMGMPSTIPPAVVTQALASYRYSDLADIVTVAIDLMDLAEGDPDFEIDTDFEPTGDEMDASFPEAINQSRRTKVPDYRVQCALHSEDAEEDDPQGDVTDDDPAFDKRSLKLANRSSSGPGCSISDPGLDDANEDEPCGRRQVDWHLGPGCPISDPGGCPLDHGEAGSDHGAWS